MSRLKNGFEIELWKRLYTPFKRLAANNTYAGKRINQVFTTLSESPDTPMILEDEHEFTRRVVLLTHAFGMNPFDLDFPSDVVEQYLPYNIDIAGLKMSAMSHLQEPDNVTLAEMAQTAKQL